MSGIGVSRALVLHDLIEVASQLSVRPGAEALCAQCFDLIAEMGTTTHDECAVAAQLIVQARAELGRAAA